MSVAADSRGDLRVGLRVGLTGGLGSGKSTVRSMLTALGAYGLSADDLARSLMEPVQSVYAAIVQHFGSHVLAADGTLDRPALAKLAFGEGRVEELNAIVHPATIALQAERMAAIFEANPAAVVVVESALLFETKHGAEWQNRFDRIVLVTAPEATKIARFVARSGGQDVPALEREARRRLDQLIPDEQKFSQVDHVLHNDGTLAELQQKVNDLWGVLNR